MEGFAQAPIETIQTDSPASVESLVLHNFRNFSGLHWEIPAAGAVIVGPNGSGKTNLLEAIYYLEIFRSFRGVRDGELVRFGEDVFRVEAKVRRAGRLQRLAAAYSRSGRRKKVEVDGREPARVAAAFGSLGAVVFSLGDVEIVRGAPGYRRRFLDILLSLTEPGYLPALQRYRAVLAQRNGALRGGADAALLDVWTDGLVDAGARVMAARAAWVAGSRSALRRYHERISGGWPAELAYEPAIGRRAAAELADEEGAAVPEEVWEERLRRALRDGVDRDRRRGVTLTGPQRDDVSILAHIDDGDEPHDLRSFGSGGQQRTAALALRLVEADTLTATLGREPIYLVDDVFAELDSERSARILGLLDEGRAGQVLLTAPKRTDVPLREGGLRECSLRDGRFFS